MALPKQGVEFIFYISLSSQASPKTFQANPTLAAGDVLVATDDGAPANITTLPIVDADFTKRIKVTLSAAEMTGENATIIFSDVAGAEWSDLQIDLPIGVNNTDDVKTDTATLVTGVNVSQVNNATILGDGDATPFRT